MLSGLLPSDYILNLSFGYSKINNKFGKNFFQEIFFRIFMANKIKLFS